MPVGSRRWSSAAPPMPAPPAWTASSPRRLKPRWSGERSGPTWRSSRRASGRPAPIAATRSAPQRRPPPSVPAPTSLSSAGPSCRRRTSAPPPRRSSARSLPRSPRWPRPKEMAKGYWIGRVDVSDPAVYAIYAAANPAIFAKFGGRFVVRGGAFEAPEGVSRARNVVIEFPDYGAALACYRSDEYQANAKHRVASAVSDLVIIAGYDPPPPKPEALSERYDLVPVTSPAEWQSYHAI